MDATALALGDTQQQMAGSLTPSWSWLVGMVPQLFLHEVEERLVDDGLMHTVMDLAIDEQLANVDHIAEHAPDRALVERLARYDDAVHLLALATPASMPDLFGDREQPGSNPFGNGDRLGAAVAGTGDLDGDGRPDFIAAGIIGGLHAYSGKDGRLMFSLLKSGRWFQLASSVDIDGVGTNDIVASFAMPNSRGSYIAGVFSGKDGHELYSYASPYVFPVLAVAGVPDMNGDGHEEFLIGAPTFALVPGTADCIPIRPASSSTSSGASTPTIWVRALLPWAISTATAWSISASTVRAFRRATRPSARSSSTPATTSSSWPLPVSCTRATC